MQCGQGAGQKFAAGFVALETGVEGALLATNEKGAAVRRP